MLTKLSTTSSEHRENYIPCNKGFNMDTALQFPTAFVAFLLPVPLFQP